MGSTQHNFGEDFEHESRRIKYQINPDQLGLFIGEGADYKPVPFVDEVVFVRSREEGVTNKSTPG